MDFVGGCALFVVLFVYFTVGTPKILSGARRLWNHSLHYEFVFYLAADPTRSSGR
jgi:hypothetical protein